jgi:hypothetical protein
MHEAIQFLAIITYSSICTFLDYSIYRLLYALHQEELGNILEVVGRN